MGTTTRVEREHRDSKGKRPRRRRRILVAVLGAALVLLVVAAFAIRTPASVGHWESQEGQDRFMSAYAAAFDELPEPAETLDVRTDYGFVRVYRFSGTGDAEHPLLLLPGTSSATPVWADNLPSLLALGDVITLDLLGEPGMSVQERPITSEEDQAAWLAETLRELPQEAFHVVGLSIGGWSATNLALHDPSNIATLTLIDPAVTLDDIPLETALRSLPAAVPWLPKSWRDSFNSYTAGGAPVEDVPVADMIEAGMQHYSLKIPQPARISEERLASIDLPVLVILAGDSVMLDAENASAVAERALPHATVHVYDGASHAVNGEEPERIAKDIEELIT
ncbi:MAG TPA: alpha/beta hydrolase [Candidatus Agrococcus pullicola]|uniref:Alpha/beta hydrolase n=1 Tax=Candidatus Agrococcus pullicola TaxID=2838429 RepID=A0A9D2CA18_9MICO|nr:alpha/beta hydrolase [Candidatus Agrococcus pullicola]